MRLCIICLFAVAMLFVSCDQITTKSHTKQVATPQFNPPGGTYTSAQTVSISCETPDAVILYTTDDTEPNSESILYTAPIAVNSSMVLRARAFKTDWIESEIGDAWYYINLPDTVMAPIISPHDGTYNGNLQVTISSYTEGATIRYTLNGAEPDSNSAIYSGSISIHQTTTVKARAFKQGMVASEVTTNVYIINISDDLMIHVTGGQFTMGRTIGTGSSDELPLHEVWVSSFYIGKHEVTQTEWTTIMGYNPSHFTGNPNNPVETINWYEVMVYCNKKSILEGKSPVYSIEGVTNPDEWGSIPTTDNNTWNNALCNWNGNGYRMPTEAEWEYAARGATTSPDYIYAGSNNVGDVAWYEGNSNNTTHTIGIKQPNGLGIFDMSGNVWEWCWDWFGLYGSQFANNPVGPASGSSRILRGGAWDANDDDGRRIASRGWWIPPYKMSDGGLRLVRSN